MEHRIADVLAQAGGIGLGLRRLQLRITGCHVTALLEHADVFACFALCRFHGHAAAAGEGRLESLLSTAVATPPCHLKVEGELAGRRLRIELVRLRQHFAGVRQLVDTAAQQRMWIGLQLLLQDGELLIDRLDGLVGLQCLGLFEWLIQAEGNAFVRRLRLAAADRCQPLLELARLGLCMRFDAHGDVALAVHGHVGQVGKAGCAGAAGGWQAWRCLAALGTGRRGAVGCRLDGCWRWSVEARNLSFDKGLQLGLPLSRRQHRLGVRRRPGILLAQPLQGLRRQLAGHDQIVNHLLLLLLLELLRLGHQLGTVSQRQALQDRLWVAVRSIAGGGTGQTGGERQGPVAEAAALWTLACVGAVAGRRTGGERRQAGHAGQWGHRRHGLQAAGGVRRCGVGRRTQAEGRELCHGIGHGHPWWVQGVVVGVHRNVAE